MKKIAALAAAALLLISCGTSDEDDERTHSYTTATFSFTATALSTTDTFDGSSQNAVKALTEAGIYSAGAPNVMDFTCGYAAGGIYRCTLEKAGSGSFSLTLPSSGYLRITQMPGINSQIANTRLAVETGRQIKKYYDANPGALSATYSNSYNYIFIR